MVRVGTLPLVLALIAGMVGCGGGVGPPEGGPYAVDISVTPGGRLTSPGEGVFDYDEGTIVDLSVEVDEGYIFSHWFCDVENIIDDLYGPTTRASILSDCHIKAVFLKLAPMIAAGWDHTVGLASGSFLIGGAVVSTKYDCSSWTGIVQIAAGGDIVINTGFTVGVLNNGSVVTTAPTLFNTSSWTGVVRAAAGGRHIVGRKSNGTVVATTSDWGAESVDGFCNVDTWTNIVQVAAGPLHTVGLYANGAVVAVGKDDQGQCNVGGWTDIIQMIAAGGEKGTTVGLKASGTVVAVGDNGRGQCNVDTWTDIIQVAGGEHHTVGLRSNGTVVAVGSNDEGQCDVDDWTDIIQVAAGAYHTVGLKSDGTAVAVGLNTSGQLAVDGWDLIP
jgi:hypothetical protein